MINATSFVSVYRIDQYLYWVWSLVLSICAVIYWKPSNEEKLRQNLPTCQSLSLESKCANEEKKVNQEKTLSSIVYSVSQSFYIPRALLFQSHKKKLILDLDETLISSSIKHSTRHDIAVRVNINGMYSNFYVRKRPHVDHFLETVSQWYELIIFTASLSPYANAVIDKLDPNRRITRRYYRQSCLNKSGCYVKDLQTVCKDLTKVAIIDNSPIAYSMNKENAIAIDDYIGYNPNDISLLNLIPLLEEMRHFEDVREFLKTSQQEPTILQKTKRSNMC